MSARAHTNGSPSAASTTPAAGFADPTLLRKHLRGAVGLTPNAYRRSYAAPQADSA